MGEVLRSLLSIAVLTFSVATMLGVGLGHTVHDLLQPMRDTRSVTRALLANFVLVPLLAFGMIHALPLHSSYETGLMLIATAAGAPFLMRLTQSAGGNLPLSASLTLLLVPATVVTMPLTVPLLMPNARVNPLAIAVPLVFTMLLPLGVGLVARTWKPEPSQKLRPWLAKLSEAALATLVVSTVLTNLDGIWRLMAAGAIFAPVLFILGAFLIGYAMGNESRGGHVVLGLGTAQRNVAAAMVVATQGLDDPNTVVMVVVASLVELALLFPMAWALKRRRGTGTKVGTGYFS